MNTEKIITVNAEWTNDCQGKKDYDGSIVSLLTRYWPGNYQENGKPSAKAKIIFRYRLDNIEESDILASKDFEGETEEEVKMMVEKWALEENNRLRRALYDLLYKRH